MKKVFIILTLFYIILNVKSFDFKQSLENLKSMGMEKLKNISQNLNFTKLKNLTDSINMDKLKEFGKNFLNSTQNINVKKKLQENFSQKDLKDIGENFANVINSSQFNKFDSLVNLLNYLNKFYFIFHDHINTFLNLIPNFPEFIDKFHYFGLNEKQIKSINFVFENKGKNEAIKKCIKKYKKIEILNNFSELLCDIFINHTEEIMKKNNKNIDL